MHTIGKVWLALLLLAFTPIVSVALQQGAPHDPVSNETVVHKNTVEPTLQQLEAKALEMTRERNNATADNDNSYVPRPVRSQWI
jgi:hypothetical protein